MEFSETIAVCDLKLAKNDRSDKKFKTLSPGACLPPPRGYIHVLNLEKKKKSNQTSKGFLWNL